MPWLLQNLGCLWVPPIEPEPSELVPPEIQEATPDTGAMIPIRDQDCPTTCFQVHQVADQNIDDNLSVRWWIDVDPEFRNGPDGSNSIPPQGGVVRVEPDPLIPRLTFCVELASLDRAKTHTVTLVVADRPFLNDPLSSRALPRDAGSDTVVWPFVIQAGGLCVTP